MNKELNELVTRLETRVRQLALRQRELLDEQDRLRQELAGKDREISSLRARADELSQQYARLKAAKYIDMADDDVKDIRGRIRTMVRDIDRCISMLKVT